MLSKISSDVQRQVELGISLLKQGGLVAFPTDTVYGLGASASIPQAVQRLYQVKQRPRHMALPLLLANKAQISQLAETVPATAWLLVEQFLPGALTIVLAKSCLVPDIVTGGGSTVAIRIPDHPVPIALVKGLGTPIVGTSANLSGQPSAVTTAEVLSQLGDKIDLVINGGGRLRGRESTLVDITGKVPVLLRQGAIPLAELRRVCGHIIFRRGSR